ncbi:MAG: NUDIX domain-containing protein [Bacteroidota bacterium]
MRTNFPYVGASYLFLIKDNKILLQRRYNTGFQDGNYGVPSGHLDGGETAREGCVREVREEIGIEIEITDLEVVHVMHRKAAHDERIDFFMRATRYTGEITNIETHKCDDLSWFPLDSLPVHTIDYVKQAIECYRACTQYSEYGW